MDKRQDLIYLGGYIDGDGSFYIHKTTHGFQQAVSISSTNFEIISHLIENYGGSYSTRIIKIENKPVYKFAKYCKNALHFAEIIHPFLIQRKKECELLISSCKTKSVEEILNIQKELRYQHDTVNLVSFDDVEKLKNIAFIQPTEEDFIHLAGFIDAECCLTINKYIDKRTSHFVYKIELHFGDMKSDMFYWIKPRFNGSCYFRKRKHPLKNQLIWKTSGKFLYPLLKKIYPYLRYKKPVCEKFIEFYEETLIKSQNRSTEKYKILYEEMISKKESIYQHVKILNKKGL